MRINTKLYSKVTTLILSLLFVMQLMPITSFADVISEKQSNDKGSVLSTSVENGMEMPDIVCEIESEKSEYSKKFLLEDGSFCSVISALPINTSDNDECNSSISATAYTTINDVVNNINDSCSLVDSTDSSLRSTNNLSNLEINWADNSEETIDGDLWYVLDGESASFYMRALDVGQYISNNYLIMSATFSVDCICSGSGEDYVRIYTNEEWDDDYSNIVSNTEPISERTINTDGNYTFNITDVYNKWERGNQENNGLSFTDDYMSGLMVSNPCLVIRYIDVDSNELDFTYHSVDLKNSGKIYINDITNNFKVEQKILDYKYNQTDLSIVRIYDSASENIYGNYGKKSSFNIESKLVEKDSFYEWTMFSGDKTYFVPSGVSDVSGNYLTWEMLQTAGTGNLVATLFTPATEDSELESYVSINNLKYVFNESGNITDVIDTASEDVIMHFDYSESTPNRIREVDLQGGNKIVFKYNPSMHDILESVEIQNSNGDVITTADNTELKTEFDYSISNGQIMNTVTYGNNGVSVYTFDVDGHLLNTVNEMNVTCDFDYASDTGNNLLNYLTGYEIYDNGSLVESMSIDSTNTFKRVFTDSTGNSEVFYYNSEYKLVNYIDSDGKYKSIDYDENGLINSYVFEYSGDELVQNNTFSVNNLSKWTKIGKSKNISKKNIPGNNNKYGARFGSSDYEVDNLALYQNITDKTDGSAVVFEADKTYVFGGKVYLDDLLPDLDKSITITIEVAPVINGVAGTNYTEYSKITFDNTLLGEIQFRLRAFKLDNDSVIRIKLNYNNQCGFAYFTDITLFESQEAITDLDGMITSSPIEYNYSDGKIESEELTWNHSDNSSETMGTHYSYSQDGKRSEYVDYNGLHTYYQYDENGMLAGKGHNLDNQNNISDLNSLAYDAERALSNTTQVIKNVENNNDITLSTSYEKNTSVENGNTVTSVTVTHNGYDQVYKYNSDGTLIETYAQSSSPGSTTNNNIKYNYENNDIVSIEYSNGYRDEYCSIECDDEEYIEQGVSTIKYIARYVIHGENEELLKTYFYMFDESGELIKFYDDSTHILIDYEENGYSLHESNDDGFVLIFSNISDDTGVKYIYSNTYSNSADSNNSDISDIMEITDSSVSLSAEGITTSSSLVSVDKNYDDFIMTADYERTSVEDFFGRLTRKEISAEYNVRRDMSGSMTSSSEYEYKALPDGKTSGLISGYTSTISGTFDNSSTGDQGIMTSSNFSKTYSRKYEYDNKGNVIFVYDEDNGNTVPKEYYEYDDANQVITEINFENGISAHYTYDAGGNLTAKIYYNYEDLVFNVSDREIVSLGNEAYRVTYQYDSVWKDRLINYNGTAITYDEMGNPLNYVGTDNEGNTITGTLEWQGNLLTAFESESMRVEYQYDKNDYRTYKIVYNKRNNVIIGVSYVIDYLWDNGTLIGLIISDIRDEERYELMNVNFIYDEDGSPAGYISYISIPYMFGKDIHENVLSLMFPNGENLFEYSYDSWGNATIEYSENWSSNILTNLMAVITARFCPMAYHGYLYDYETGMCFNKGRCYSPDWARNLNPEDYEKLVERPENPLDANLYLFCNNNPLNILDETASWSRNYTGIEWKSNGFEISMNELFASRPVCAVIASQIIKTNGSWDVENGYNYMGMSAERIAADLFAHYVGKTAKAAINKVNAVWGDGWILKNSKSDKIFVCNKDLNSGKYIKIWRAAPEIKAYAQKEGIFINL